MEDFEKKLGDTSEQELSAEAEDLRIEKEKHQEFIREQTSLPPREWSEEFRDYTEKKYKESQSFEDERTPEEQREDTFKRYIRDLDLGLNDLKDKRVMDLGCGEEGEFVRVCLEEGVTREIYGVDVRGSAKDMSEEYRKHVYKADFEKEIPGGEYDYIISEGAVFGWEGDQKKTLILSLQALKDDGEIRIYPIQKPLKGEMPELQSSYKKWHEILEDISSEKNVEYELKPMDIKVSGKDRDVWLEELLIIRKR